MRAAGRVVWLTARPETILARMSADAATPGRRPALTELGPLAEIVQLLGQREPMYREAAHMVIDTEDKSPEQLAGEILALHWVGPRGNRPVNGIRITFDMFLLFAFGACRRQPG